MKDRYFISYRRADASGEAALLAVAIRARFGLERVFMDVDSIAFGHDFVHALEDALDACSTLLVVIGPDWLNASDTSGRRLDVRDDFVRREIEAGLRRDLLVVPILVRGAQLPALADLPTDLRGLSRRQIARLNPDSVHDDIDRLMTALEASPTGTMRTRRIGWQPEPGRRFRVRIEEESRTKTTFRPRNAEGGTSLQRSRLKRTYSVECSAIRQDGSFLLAFKPLTMEQTLSDGFESSTLQASRETGEPRIKYTKPRTETHSLPDEPTQTALGLGWLATDLEFELTRAGALIASASDGHPLDRASGETDSIMLDMRWLSSASDLSDWAARSLLPELPMEPIGQGATWTTRRTSDVLGTRMAGTATMVLSGWLDTRDGVLAQISDRSRYSVDMSGLKQRLEAVIKARNTDAGHARIELGQSEAVDVTIEIVFDVTRGFPRSVKCPSMRLRWTASAYDGPNDSDLLAEFDVESETSSIRATWDYES